MDVATVGMGITALGLGFVFEAAMLVARIKYPEPRDLHREQLRKIRCRAAHLISLRNSSEKNRLWNHLAFRTR